MEEEVPVGDEELDVIGIERKQMIVDVLVLPLMSKQKKTATTKVMPLTGEQPCCCCYC